MSYIIPAAQRRPSGAEKANMTMDRAMQFAQAFQQQQAAEQQQQQIAEAYRGMGLDPRIAMLPPEAQKAYFQEQFASEKALTPLQETQRQLAQEKINALQGRQNLYKQLTAEAPATAAQAPAEGQNLLSQLDEGKLRQLSAFAGQPGEEGIIGNLAESELKKKEKEEKALSKKQEKLREETLPIRKEISERAQLARQGIENKERGLDIIERGDLDDPTYAIFAELMPYNLGKRLLSNDTVEYKAGLVDEFADLRKIFSGQTRVKEIDLLEDKIADLYLTNDQKKAILKSRINVLKSDLIREEAAAELEAEGKFFGVLQFRREVEKRAKPKLDALFNKVLDEQKAIIKDAENQKKIPLDINDPDGKRIIEEIFNEAGRDWKKAEALAKKKGYHW